MNDFSIQDFENEIEEIEIEEIEDDFEEIEDFSREENNQKFNSVLDFFSVMIEKSYGMFDKMMDVLKNFN